MCFLMMVYQLEDLTVKPVFLNDGVSTGGLTVKPVFLNDGVSTGGFNCESRIS